MRNILQRTANRERTDMIRYVHIRADSGVMPGGDCCFAWFDTVTDLFLRFNGAEVWVTWDDFEADWKLSLHEEARWSREIDRFRQLFDGNAEDEAKAHTMPLTRPIPGEALPVNERCAYCNRPIDDCDCSDGDVSPEMGAK